MKPRFTDLGREIKKSDELERLLIERGSLCPPDSDDDRNRQLALEYVQALLIKWQAEELLNLGIQEEHQYISKPIILPFGSYRLRVHHKDADIDILCLFDENAISREMFFSNFVDFLSKVRHLSISNLLAIASYTPVVKFFFKDIRIHVDLVFASLKLESLHKILQNNALSSDIVTGMDEASVRSLNGVRVTQFIERSVKGIQSFRVSLCALKAWGNTNGIYSNALGGLGGINFALLLTYVYIEYKDSASWPATLVLQHFFRMFSLHDWPQPVMLTRGIDPNPPANLAQLQVWEQSPRDIMPIITPVYPYMNSSHNVAIPQFRRIRDELIRTAMKLEQGSDWATLLQDCDFFLRHSNFIQVTISATDDDRYYRWSSFCRSKLRLLISSLETRKIAVWPFTKFFEKEESCSFHGRRSYFFLALRFSPPLRPGKINLKHLTLDFLHRVNAFKGRTEGMDLQISHRLQEELPDFILEKYTTK